MQKQIEIQMQDARCKMQNTKYKIQDNDMISLYKPNSNDSVIKQNFNYANIIITRIITQPNSRISMNLVNMGRSIGCND
jgi:hypothetical protein